MPLENLKDSVVLITGGTGSFGEAVLQRLLDSNVSEVRVFSRDEKKQDDMRKRYSSPRLKLYLGDVRDIRSVRKAMLNVDYVFHAAALKQVPSCEFHPMEAVRTNILGTENVLDAAIEHAVKKIVCLSTDKAVYPINAMGISKALMEKVMAARSRDLEDSETVVCCTRYGNVMGSRGSVIPLFVDQVLSDIPVTLTNPEMTRFMMSMDDAVELVLFAFQHARNGDIFVQKAPAASVKTLLCAVLAILNKDSHPIMEIGTRHGEKLFESLLSQEEMIHVEDLGKYFRIPADARDLNYSKFFERGEQIIATQLPVDGYNSHNSTQLDLEQMQALLRETGVLSGHVKS